MEREKERITFEKLTNLFTLGTMHIKNEALYNKIEKFVNAYHPEREFPKGEKSWVFYFPCEDEEEGKEYLIPFFINKIRNGNFWVKIRDGGEFLIEKDGKEENKKEELLFSLINRAMEIQNSLTKKEIESKIVYRYGRIQRKYLCEPELTKEEGKKVLKDYERNRKTKRININLDIYLNVAAMVIRGIVNDPELESLKPKEVYDRSVDFRRVYPFNRLNEIKNLKEISGEQLLKSVKEDRKTACHTFEITSGVVLFPSKREFFVGLRDPGAYMEYLKAIEILIKNKIPFSTDKKLLKDMINFATGEAIVEVMDIEIPKENYSKVIEWEELPVPKPKSKLEIRE